mmetsp:Transcript_2233/g.3863  ORF Transcript_2233/g.3863 Transcript_2233/m.3863 type:complete len:156 (+) Transcript_2233:302-769(+)
MDSGKYEDFIRQLLGQNAFLLFQVDKIIHQMMKQLIQMHADQNCNRAVKLFKEISADSLVPALITESPAKKKPARVVESVERGLHSERIYLSSYLNSVIEKYHHHYFSKRESSLVRARSAGKDKSCLHSISKFQNINQGIDQEDLKEHHPSGKHE